MVTYSLISGKVWLVLRGGFYASYPSSGLLVTSTALVALPSVYFSRRRIAAGVGGGGGFRVCLVPFLFVALGMMGCRLSSLVALFGQFQLRRGTGASVLIAVVLGIMVGMQRPAPLYYSSPASASRCSTRGGVDALGEPSQVSELAALLMFFDMRVATPLPGVTARVVRSRFVTFFRACQANDSDFSVLSTEKVPGVPDRLACLVTTAMFVILAFISAAHYMFPFNLDQGAGYFANRDVWSASGLLHVFPTCVFRQTVSTSPVGQRGKVDVRGHPPRPLDGFVFSCMGVECQLLAY